MRVPAPAKLNLFLNVVGRRADGYHLIESLFAFVGLADHITVAPAARPLLSVEGEFAAGLGPEADNLAARARDLLLAEAGLAPSLALGVGKRIPVAAGLGGGSADAAAVLVALDRELALDWPIERLAAIAARIGADVPACLESRPVIARGIGDELSPAPAMPPCGVLLANPRAPTPTPLVFQRFRELQPAIEPRGFPPLPARFSDLAALVAAIAPRGNDLLPAALSVTPAIGDVLRTLGQLPGAAHAGLSGSGATCFALFASQGEAAEGERQLARQHPGWWSWAGSWFSGP